MVFSKRSLEGYYLNDNTLSGGGRQEFPMATCSHCQRGVVMNPNRTRDRPYCPKCDHYICDDCEFIRVRSGGECKTFKQRMDEVEKLASRLII